MFACLEPRPIVQLRTTCPHCREYRIHSWEDGHLMCLTCRRGHQSEPHERLALTECGERLVQHAMAGRSAS